MSNWRDLDWEEIPQWPKRQQHILLSCALVIAIALAWLCYLSPFNRQISQALQQEASLKKQFLSKQAQVANFAALDYKLKQMQLAQKKLHLLFLNKQEQAKFLNSVNALGAKHQLIIQRLDWLEPQPFASFSALPIKLELKGQFRHFGQFSEALSRLPKILSLQKITIEKDKLAQGLHFSITAQSYNLQPVEGKNQ